MAERVPKCINNKKDEEHPPEGYYSLASLVPRPVARQAREGAVALNVRKGVVQAVYGGHVASPSSQLVGSQAWQCAHLPHCASMSSIMWSPST